MNNRELIVSLFAILVARIVASAEVWMWVQRSRYFKLIKAKKHLEDGCTFDIPGSFQSEQGTLSGRFMLLSS